MFFHYLSLKFLFHAWPRLDAARLWTKMNEHYPNTATLYAPIPMNPCHARNLHPETDPRIGNNLKLIPTCHYKYFSRNSLSCGDCLPHPISNFPLSIFPIFKNYLIENNFVYLNFHFSNFFFLFTKNHFFKLFYLLKIIF